MLCTDREVQYIWLLCALFPSRKSCLMQLCSVSSNEHSLKYSYSIGTDFLALSLLFNFWTCGYIQLNLTLGRWWLQAYGVPAVIVTTWAVALCSHCEGTQLLAGLGMQELWLSSWCRLACEDRARHGAFCCLSSQAWWTLVCRWTEEQGQKCRRCRGTRVEEGKKSA